MEAVTTFRDIHLAPLLFLLFSGAENTSPPFLRTLCGSNKTNSHNLQRSPSMAPLLFLLFSLSGAKNASLPFLHTLYGPNKTSNSQSFDINFVNSMELIYDNITVGDYDVVKLPHCLSPTDSCIYLL